ADGQPSERYDLLFSNAALHWLPDHASLLPRLLEMLNESGVLAVQMPRNFAAPSHALLFDVAESSPWRQRLAPLVRRKPVEAPEWYYRLLAPYVHSVTLWETEYWQTLSGDNPVVAWVKGTWLKPFLDALGDDAPAFEREYAGRIAAAYPPERNGSTLFSFRRLFFVAVR
ncbi:MAG: trans-aconitate 2-methyltransferase, partial [Burkholderiales bacterium]